jgi:hypothetical protein
MNVWRAVKLNVLLYTDAWFLRVIFASIKLFTPKIKNMDQLDAQLLALIFEKFDVANDTAEGKIEALINAGIRLERARVGFLALQPDADFLDVASGLITLADLFDDAGLPAEKRADLETAVGKILKVSDPVKVAAATEVFIGCLDAGITAADAAAYIDKLSEPDV